MMKGASRWYIRQGGTENPVEVFDRYNGKVVARVYDWDAPAGHERHIAALAKAAFIIAATHKTLVEEEMSRGV